MNSQNVKIHRSGKLKRKKFQGEDLLSKALGGPYNFALTSISSSINNHHSTLKHSQSFGGKTDVLHINTATEQT